MAGGLLAPQTGVIYAFPAHTDEVLCVDSNLCESKEHNDESWRVSTIPIKRHAGDTDPHDLPYKWLGGSYGADGCIFGMPSDATTILRIDPLKNEAITFGKVDASRNKFQGGVLSVVDKCVYAVPADAGCVLKSESKFISLAAALVLINIATHQSIVQAILAHHLPFHDIDENGELTPPIYLRGDKSFHYEEDEEGYTLIQDPTSFSKRGRKRGLCQAQRWAAK